MSNHWKPRPFAVKIDHHPDTVKVGGASEGLRHLYDSAHAINDAIARATDLRSLLPAIKARAADAAKKATNKLGQVRAAERHTRDKVRDALTKRSTEFDREVRDMVRTSKDPAKTVRDLIASGDAAVVGSIFRAPTPLLLAITDDQLHLAYRIAAARYAPDDFEEAERISAAGDRLEKALGHFNVEIGRIAKALEGSDPGIIAALAPKSELVE